MNETELAITSHDEDTEDPTENQLLGNAPSPEQEHFVLRVVTGNDAGAVIVLTESSYLVGRGSCSGIRIDSTSASRMHARLTRECDALVLEDLGSRNGTWVDATRLSGPHVLREGQLITIGDTVMRLSLLDSRELASARAVADAARKDPLTSCFNRGYFDQRLLAEVARAQSNRRSTSLLMIDLDHFKAINDRFGHSTGDSVLRAVGHALAATTRSEDVVARYGGEEFVVIVPGATVLGAALLAQRVRTAIEQLTIEAEGEVLRLTASLGVASLERGRSTSAQILLQAADAALYAAKQAGRNRVCIGQLAGEVEEECAGDGFVTATVIPEG